MLIEFVNLIDRIDWSSLSSLKRCSELLRIKIDTLEDSIPEYIDDDWFSLPQNVPLSYKLRILRDLRKKIQKCIEDVETDLYQDSQDSNEVDSQEVTDYNPSDYL